MIIFFIISKKVLHGIVLGSLPLQKMLKSSKQREPERFYLGCETQILPTIPCVQTVGVLVNYVQVPTSELYVSAKFQEAIVPEEHHLKDVKRLACKF